ncbi:OsmC family protein [Agrobacterium sp. SOY23]|uniref:OsmC family protein n=1 Tax=Agrobacterium sp. SOY23 TaxID=3014555 RepID=UPI0022B06086|nr:OsmC family protein [Agrobacterium sp. SOY23]MCZ4429028.1 OsmC family protein [Agrobacterium sp. SOY23]
MVDGAKVKLRPVGASAKVGRLGRPLVSTVTGGSLEIVTGVSEPGFNPIDLLYASLAACLALSARIAASHMGLLDRFEGAAVDVSGEKSAVEPYRIIRFDIGIAIAGDFDAATRTAIAHMAEDICTVSNTLKGDAEFALSITG